jgi:hypothetical protein
MTDEQINAAIADACGWKEIDGLSAKGLMGKPPEALCSFNYIPNYCNDLNAMAEAEKRALQDIWNVYINKLAKATNAEDSCDPRFFCAPARQRAEAFLRTLGKYKETYVSNPEKCPRCGAGLSYPIKDGHANYECNSFMTNEGGFGQDVMCARLEKITAPLLTQIEKLKIALLERRD